MVVSGIYEIKNKLNNHRYVGSSIDIKERIAKHIRLLNKNKHHCKHLQYAWNKYGSNHFEFNVLEICEPIKDTLLFIEQKYLDLKPEYNTCQVAGNTLGIKTHVKDHPWNVIQRKQVLMLDLENNIIMEFDSIRKAALYSGGLNCRSAIQRVLKHINKTFHGYKWELKEIYHATI